MSNYIIALFTSTAFLGFLQFMIGRRDKKEEKSIDKKLDDMTELIKSVQRGCTRTQLMFLMTAYKNRHEEIMKVAYRYFVEIKGDWYVSGLFKQWLDDEKLDKPEWFVENI